MQSTCRNILCLMIRIIRHKILFKRHFNQKKLGFEIPDLSTFVNKKMIKKIEYDLNHTK